MLPLTPSLVSHSAKGQSHEASQNGSEALRQNVHQDSQTGAPEKRSASHARRYPRLMTCYSPINGYRGPGGAFVTVKAKSPTRVEMTIPCGRCIGCRLDKARDWRVRCACEAQMHETNSFLTLTYNDEHLPPNYGLRMRDLTLFIKRLRKSLGSQRVRYYACGEYGETDLRPHYHVCLFGHDFPDKIPHKKSEAGFMLCTSEKLEKLWTSPDTDKPYGFALVSNFSPETAGYVARYTMKKISGPPAADHYLRCHPLTGEVAQVQPETAVMSKRPGLGQPWFDKFEADCFPKDFLVLDAQKYPIPKAFSRRLKERKTSDDQALVDRNALEPISLLRKERAKLPENVWNNSPERLAVRGDLKEYQISRLKRL